MMTNILPRNMSQFGVYGARLVKMFPAEPFPNAQYPDAAAEKNVEITTE
jgi:hypothetical protein